MASAREDRRTRGEGKGKKVSLPHRTVTLARRRSLLPPPPPRSSPREGEENRRKGGGVFCLLFPPVSLFLPLLSLSLSVPRFPFFFGKERREKGGRREQPLPPPPSPPSSPFSCSSSVVSAEITRSPSLGPREIRLATSRSKSKNRSGKSLGKRDGKSDTADGESPLTSSVSCSSGGSSSFLAESL